MFGELVRRGWIVEGTGQYHSPVSLTTAGENAFSALRVDVPSARASKRKFGYGCLDWTERQQHLGGALGAEMLKSLEKSETITRNGVDRTARVAGPINDWLDASGL